MMPMVNQLLTPIRRLVVALREGASFEDSIADMTPEEGACLKVIADALSEDEIGKIPSELFDEHPAFGMARNMIAKFREGLLFDFFGTGPGDHSPETAADALKMAETVLPLVRELDLEAWRHIGSFALFIQSSAAVGVGALPQLHYRICLEDGLDVPPDIDALMRWVALLTARAQFCGVDSVDFPEPIGCEFEVHYESGRYPMIGCDESLERLLHLPRMIKLLSDPDGVEAFVSELLTHAEEHWIDIEWVVPGVRGDAVSVRFKSGQEPPKNLDGIRYAERE